MMLRWGRLLLLHPAFARASYSYSYVSTVDEPVGTKKNSTARGEKKYRGFESFKYPPREDPDVTVCKEIKQLTTDCMRAYNCTGDDDAPAAAFEASPLEYNDKGQVSACAAAQTSAAFWKDCHGQLTGFFCCSDCVALFHDYVECQYAFFVDKYWNGECEFKCDGVYGAAASRARGRFAALGSLLLVLLLR
jgi:hypothetical protein